MTTDEKLKIALAALRRIQRLSGYGTVIRQIATVAISRIKGKAIG